MSTPVLEPTAPDGTETSDLVLIVDDVMSAGTAVRESIALIQAAGATPHAVAIALDRQEMATEKQADGTVRDVSHSAVQYVRWPLSQSQTEAVRSGEALVEIVIRHPNYTHTTSLTAEQRKAISEDV